MTDGAHYLKKELYALFQEDESIFEFLQSATLDGIWYWDLDDPDVEWMSARFWEVLGVDPTRKKHLAAEWQDLIHPDDLSVAMENFEAHCANPDHPYDQVVRYRHADGSTVWVRCRGLAIRNVDGKAVRMLGAHTNLTELKLVEQNLRRKTEELEAANAELTRALSEIDALHGILPICSYCKKIRDGQGEWHPLESFIRDRSKADFSHSICPDCISTAESDLDSM